MTKTVYQYCDKCKTEGIHIIQGLRLFCMDCGKESKILKRNADTNKKQ